MKSEGPANKNRNRSKVKLCRKLQQPTMASDHHGEEMMPKMITFLSSLLQRVAEANDLKTKLEPQKITVFHGLTRPTISIHSYLQRIFKYANCSPSCFVVAYIYLDRFVQKQSSFPITSFNVHRMLITSVLISAKFMDDIYYNNAYYAKVGGISSPEMNVLELDFLFGVGFELNVSPTIFHTYCSFLQREMLLLQPPLGHFSENSGSLSRGCPPTQRVQASSFTADESNIQKRLAV